MKTKDFIKFLLEEDGDMHHFQNTLKQYGISVVEENDYKDQGLWLYHRRGAYFSLSGENISCMLEWMLRNIKAETVAATKNNCRENFKKNLMSLLD